MAALEAPEKAPSSPDPAPSSSPAPAPAPRPEKAPIRLGRFTIGVNVLVQLVLTAAILFMLNAYAFKHYQQWDFSHDHKYTLSQRTQQFLKNLSKPVKLIVYMASSSNAIQIQLSGDAQATAEQYHIQQPKMVTVEVVDPFRNVGRAEELKSKYKLAPQEMNIVIAVCEDRHKIIKTEDLADFNQGNEMMGQPATIKDFKSEQAYTNALLEVSEGKKSNVYYLRGHGEPDMGVKDQPLEVFGKILDTEHLNVADLNMLNVETVPADATLVMILGPRYDLSEREIKLLDEYWLRGGRLIVALDPEINTPRLGLFLDRLGVRADDDRIMQTISLGGTTKFAVRDVFAQATGNSLIAQAMTGVNLVFAGSAQSLTLTPGAVAGSGTKVEPLATAIGGFWGEMDYRESEGRGMTLDKGRDKEAPLTVAATIERGAVGDQRVKVSSSRMVVVGSARFLQADAMNEADAAFVINSLEWLLSREQLIGIPPRQLSTASLGLEQGALQTLFWTTTIAVPGVFALIGIIVWWWRRS